MDLINAQRIKLLDDDMIEMVIADDPDAAGMVIDWPKVIAGLPLYYAFISIKDLEVRVKDQHESVKEGLAAAHISGSSMPTSDRQKRRVVLFPKPRGIRLCPRYLATPSSLQAYHMS